MTEQQAVYEAGSQAIDAGPFPCWADLEEWRPVLGYEGTYEISNRGRVRRSDSGKGIQHGRILRSHPNTKGARPYEAVQLWQHGKPHMHLVHCLIADAFLGPCPMGQEVNHKDGDKMHNTVDNLEYMTRPDNMTHAYEAGLIPSGEQHFWAKLTVKQVKEIRASSMGCRRLARAYGVSKSTVQAVRKGETWTRIA